MLADLLQEVKKTEVTVRLERVIDLHFDPVWGSAFWLDRARKRGIDPRRQIRSIEDLGLLGEMTPDDLSARPLLDYVPRRLHVRPDDLIVAQTGGTTGRGHWTAYRRDEFEDAFVTPFTVAARYVGFPAGEPWLYVGPSGPHIIGKAMRRLAESLGSPDPYSVDFDPRWVKRLPEGSFARQRYVRHILDQSLDILNSQTIGVLFTTPPVLEALAAEMSDTQREAIRGVHYGGMALRSEQLEHFQRELFPNAVHLSGYGNTLFGCCLELDVRPGRESSYFPYGNRVFFELVGDDGRPVPDGQAGQVRFTRLDETMLLVRMAERDRASAAALPADAPLGFEQPGLFDPQPIVKAMTKAAAGIY